MSASVTYFVTAAAATASGRSAIRPSGASAPKASAAQPVPSAEVAALKIRKPNGSPGDGRSATSVLPPATRALRKVIGGRYAGSGDPPSRRVDLRDERGSHAVGELALVVGVEHHDVRAPAGHERAHAAAAAERVGGVDRRRDDGFVRGEPAE